MKDAGVDEGVARAHAEALRDALVDTVATKADVQDLGRTLDHKLEILDRKIDAVEQRLGMKIEALDRKIEISSRDLVIKGAGGLVVLASLMIGLKLFG